MAEQPEVNNRSKCLGPTIVGAAFGLIIGGIVVFEGFWAGLLVLAISLLGALVGRYLATCSST